MKYALISIIISLLALTSPPSSAISNNGIVITDKEPYPLYQFSRINKQAKTPSIELISPQQSANAIVSTILKTIGIAFETISESPNIYQTEWISWHYDADSNKTLSNINNRFFNLNTRDKYKFRMVEKLTAQKVTLTFEKVERQQQHDITPDTEMVWLKWQVKNPDENAITAFIQRIQTEYEIISLASDKRVITATTVKGTTTDTEIKKISNSITLNLDTEKAWVLLTEQLQKNSIPLSKINNKQYILSTKWVHQKLDTENTAPKITQRHQFQLLVIPAAAKSSSTIFVYHTEYQNKIQQPNLDEKSWSEQETQQRIAGAFLHSLNLQ